MDRVANQSGLTSNSAKKSFDKHPRWIAQLKDFKTIGELEFKIIAWIANVRNWTSDTTPWTTIADLAVTVGTSWRRTKRALSVLAEIGAIRVTTKNRQMRFRLMFESPYTHETDGNDRCLSRCAVEGRPSSEFYAETTDNSHRFDIEPLPIQQTADVYRAPDPQDAPAWILETASRATPGLENAAYEPGADPELCDVRKPI